MRNPPWQRDEQILALDLYLKCDIRKTSQTDPKIIKLSEILRALPIYDLNIVNAETYRSPNSVHMKLCNFLQYDPGYNGKGLWRGSKLENEIWNEFYQDQNRLSTLAEAIRINAKLGFIQMEIVDEEEYTFSEGRVLYRTHKLRERNSRMTNAIKKKTFAKSGKLECSICRFDFYAFYGEIGEGFIECHHIKPVSDYIEGTVTKESDLRLICANCHRMIHKTNPLCTIEELKQRINI